MPVKLEVPETSPPSAAAVTRIAPPANPTLRGLPGPGEPGSWLDVFDARPVDDYPSIEGTCWQDTLAPHERCRFDPGGVFVYGITTMFTSGTWLQRGRHVYVETNGRYAERLGSIENEVLRLEMHNVNGFARTFACERISREAFDAHPQNTR